MNGRVTDSAVGGVGIEAAVPCGSSSMAAETQIRDTVMGEHVWIRTSMDFMTGCAAFNPRCAVLVEKRATLVGMTTEAGLMLEAPQAFTGCRLMGVVAGCAAEDSFLESVSFVQLKLREHVLMTHKTGFDGTRLEQSGFGFFGVHSVAVSAV